MTLLKLLISACPPGLSCRHDGTFTKTLVPGDGVTAKLLFENRIEIYGESEINALLSLAERRE